MAEAEKAASSGGGAQSTNSAGMRVPVEGSAGRPRNQETSNLYDSSSPQPTRTADMNSRSFKSAVTRAHNYTQDNFHQVASATMAKAFGYPDIEKGFRDIERDHERYGSLSGVPNGIERRNKLESELEKRIKRDYGQAGIDAWNRGKS